ncbi:hypothetical protein AWB75_05038 [Caballeronia catudaia]|uniref:Lipoprotein n=1 Tax=Caballeronia catudaia TaxID=1777136 RepID=A0A158CF69_9BURK|nr:hypothetical protein [Caballeronia catudaia]SAK80911.1 hypothetical protein AWB75_05038 [Caballeronia catudaia]
MLDRIVVYLALACLCGVAGAQTVSLSPAYADAASAPRFQSQLSTNLDRAPGQSVTDEQLQSERCAALGASIDWGRDNPSAQRNRGSEDFVSNTWGGADSQTSPDRQRELERQSAILGCK